MSKAESATKTHSEIEKTSERAEEQKSQQSGENAALLSGKDERNEPKKVTRRDLDDRHPIGGLVVYTILCLAALVLIVVATAIEWFVLNDEYSSIVVPNRDPNEPICVTAWGLKNGCRRKAYVHKSLLTTFCSNVRSEFEVMATFSILTIIFTTFSLLCGIFAICHVLTKGLATALAALSAATCLIAWIIPTNMYHQKPCCITHWLTPDKMKTCYFTSALNPALALTDVPPFKEMGKYGPGYGLCVAAWVVLVIAAIFARLPF
ncbi:amastin-like protein [Angomonas deanei]|nr:amastin-like protein [Angomonas deanei]|eukprot:EPY31138.1 amastin-like protein [Angomonas deanei]